MSCRGQFNSDISAVICVVLGCGDMRRASVHMPKTWVILMRRVVGVQRPDGRAKP